MPITLNGDTGIQTPMYNGSITANAVTPSVNMKNRIINGAMVISQRGTSPTITGGGEYSVDRYINYYSGNAYTSVQSTTAPAGFNNSLLLTTTTASASPAYSFFGQRIEGFNVADLGWGTANAKTVTLSFWVRSSVTGVYSVSFGNSDADRAYPVTYTISAANTWEQKTITVAGDTTGTWLTTNGIGINLRFNMGTATAGRLGTSGSWQAGNLDGATGSTGANTWANTNGATFYITGVQLEVGSTATSFDYRPYGTELALCQRYCYVLGTAGGNLSMNASGANSTTTSTKMLFNYPVTMRSAPTASFSAANTFLVQQLSAFSNITPSAITAGAFNTQSMHLELTISGGTAGAFVLLFDNTSAAKITVSAEL